MTLEEIFCKRVIKDGGKNENPYSLETRNYVHNGKVFTEKMVTFYLDFYYTEKHSIKFNVTNEEYDFLLEKMKEREKENEVDE